MRHLPFAPRSVVVPLALLLSLGCRSSTAPLDERVVGTVAPEMSSHAALQAPAIGSTAQVTVVTVITVGSSSCTRQAGAEVIYRGEVVEITPYDRVALHRACTRDLAAVPREVRLHFPSIGQYTIRVTGRSVQGLLGGAVVEVPIVVYGPD